MVEGECSVFQTDLKSSFGSGSIASIYFQKKCLDLSFGNFQSVLKFTLVVCSICLNACRNRFQVLSLVKFATCKYGTFSMMINHFFLLF